MQQTIIMPENIGQPLHSHFLTVSEVLCSFTKFPSKSLSTMATTPLVVALCVMLDSSSTRRRLALRCSREDDLVFRGGVVIFNLTERINSVVVFQFFSKRNWCLSQFKNIERLSWSVFFLWLMLHWTTEVYYLFFTYMYHFFFQLEIHCNDGIPYFLAKGGTYK